MFCSDCGFCISPTRHFDEVNSVLSIVACMSWARSIRASTGWLVRSSRRTVMEE